MINKSRKCFLLLMALSIVAVPGMSIGFSEPAQAMSCRLALGVAIKPACPRGNAICIRWVDCERSQGRTGKACMAYRCLPPSLNDRPPVQPPHTKPRTTAVIEGHLFAVSALESKDSILL